MKKTLLLFIILTVSYGYSQDVTLTTQAEVDEYVGGDVIGNLSIGLGGGSDITTLANLSLITSVTGFVWIHENPILVNLSGLDNLLTITGDLYLQDNPVTTSLTGLGGLTSVANFYYARNSTLSNLIGLGDLMNVGGYFWIENNTGLNSFSGLNMLNSITGLVYINNNDALTSFTGLESLVIIDGYFYALGNDNVSLIDFTGFNALTSVGTSFTIESNNNITSLNGFDALSSVGTTFDISTNAELTSLNGIESLITISANGGTSGFQIDANPKLTDISGMVNVDHTKISTLTIRNNTLLVTCEISNICTYLNIPGASIIFGNAIGCETSTEILAACATASVSNYLLKMAVSIYPNPTSDLLNIKIINDLIVEKVSLYAMDGRLIKEQKYQLQSIDISDVAVGIYNLRIESDKGIINTRIVKQ